MLKLVLVGVLGALTAGGGAYLNLSMRQQDTAGTEVPHAGPAVEQVAIELTAVPLIEAGKVKGYFVLRVSCTIDRSKLKHASLDLMPYLSDATFRATFNYANSGHVEIRAQHVKEMTTDILKLMNKSLGGEIVQAVNMEQFNFVTETEVRGNRFKID